MEYAVHYISPDDSTKIFHEKLPDDLKSRYRNMSYIYKVIYEVYTGEEESLEKSISLTSEKELNIDELSDRVAIIYDNESEFNDYRLYQLVAIYVKAAYRNY
ncbi:hypothetical protein V6669_09435 [Paenibacillus sp. Y5S-9]|uniref:hypothetical protein n=1 Tax=Paenibacillus sp. Y5S-9 TaxID=3122489 RepID=UPI0030D10F90